MEKVKPTREFALTNEKVWVSSDGRCKHISEMTTEHIKNCIRCWNGEGVAKLPPDYLGGKEKWLKILFEELKRREHEISIKHNDSGGVWIDCSGSTTTEGNTYYYSPGILGKCKRK